MRWKSLVFLSGLVPLTSGCNLFYYAGHNAVNEPISRLDEHKLTSRLKTESRVVWKEVCKQFPARTFTPEFADGFTDGYADHMEVGGPAVPPTVPPLRYRRQNYLTPHGHALIRDYMIGFQYGAEVAVATGKRQFLTVPVLLPEHAPEGPLNVAVLPTPPETSLDVPGSVKPKAPTPPSTPLPNPSSLPMPKAIEGGLGNPMPAMPAKPTDAASPPKANVPGVPEVKPETPAPKLDLPKLDVPKVDLPTTPSTTPASAPNPPANPPIDVKILPSSATEPGLPLAMPPFTEAPAPLPPLSEPPPVRPPAPVPVGPR